MSECSVPIGGISFGQGFDVEEKPKPTVYIDEEFINDLVSEAARQILAQQFRKDWLEEYTIKRHLAIFVQNQLPDMIERAIEKKISEHTLNLQRETQRIQLLVSQMERQATLLEEKIHKAVPEAVTLAIDVLTMPRS